MHKFVNVGSAEKLDVTSSIAFPRYTRHSRLENRPYIPSPISLEGNLEEYEVSHSQSLAQEACRLLHVLKHM